MGPAGQLHSTDDPRHVDSQPNATGPINTPNTTVSAGLAETVMRVTPLQFHFHTVSEHTLEGRFSAMEAHLVTRVTGANTSCATAAANCTAVFAVLYDLSPDALEGSDFLAPFMNQIPRNATFNTSANLGPDYTLNLTDYFPEDTSRYVQYSGSFTTPPCTEEVLWTVFPTSRATNVTQVLQLSNILATSSVAGETPSRTDNRLPQRQNGRPVYAFGGPATAAATAATG